MRCTHLETIRTHRTSPAVRPLFFFIAHYIQRCRKDTYCPSPAGDNAPIQCSQWVITVEWTRYRKRCGV